MLPKTKHDDEEYRWNKGVTQLSDKFNAAVDKFKRKVISEKQSRANENGTEEFKI